MDVNIIKEKERQQTLVYIFVFLVISIILILVFPPSFNFSSFFGTEKIEKESHLKIIETLDKINFRKLGDFETPPEFKGESGKENPFSADGGVTETTQGEVFETEEETEEAEEAEETEEIEEGNDD